MDTNGTEPTISVPPSSATDKVPSATTPNLPPAERSWAVAMSNVALDRLASRDVHKVLFFEGPSGNPETSALEADRLVWDM